MIPPRILPEIGAPTTNTALTHSGVVSIESGKVGTNEQGADYSKGSFSSISGETLISPVFLSICSESENRER